jgi:mono/diheme cytochrome c family protein
MYKNAGVLAGLAVLLLNAGSASAAPSDAAGPRSDARPALSKQVERGRYLMIVGSCNDCHTAGFAASNGNVPEQAWLLGGGPLGFRGPWGTTYAPNLRLTVSQKTEAQWVKFAKELKTRPPMPWFNLNQWTSADLRALYQYIRQLGPVGEGVVPQYVPPDQEPKPPYVQWPSPPK